MFPLCESFFVETQFATILFTNINVSGYVKVGMKLYTETLVTRNAVRLPTQRMTNPPSSVE